eukprot:7906966-Alexandrium_andersonii.AAC.1
MCIRDSHKAASVGRNSPHVQAPWPCEARKSGCAGRGGEGGLFGQSTTSPPAAQAAPHPSPSRAVRPP